MSKHKKIVTPSEEEVSAYGQRPEPPPAGNPPTGGDGPAAAERPPVEPVSVDEVTPPEGPAGRSEAEEWKDKCLRARAELANYQKRVEKERADFHRYSIADLAKALLPMIDDLDRVIETGSGPQAGLEKLLAGVKLTRDNLLKVLKQFHVLPIEAAGQPFDPQLHEAMLEQPSEAHSDRTVLQEVSRGYRLHDRLLRAARVIVSKGRERELPGEAGETGDDGLHNNA